MPNITLSVSEEDKKFLEDTHRSPSKVFRRMCAILKAQKHDIDSPDFDVLLDELIKTRSALAKNVELNRELNRTVAKLEKKLEELQVAA